MTTRLEIRCQTVLPAIEAMSAIVWNATGVSGGGKILAGGQAWSILKYLPGSQVRVETTEGVLRVETTLGVIMIERDTSLKEDALRIQWDL